MTTLASAASAHANQHPVPADTLLKQLNWRYAVKKFDAARKIPAHDIHTLKQAALLAPSSFGLEPWKFVFVTDPATRTKLRAAAWNQSQVEEASHLVVFAHRKGINSSDVEKFIGRVCEVRKAPPHALEEYKQMMLGFVTQRPAEWLDTWSARQTYIALGFLLASAAMLGIDACPMEGFDPKQFDEILGLEKHGYGSVALCALGYRAADDKFAQMAKVRFHVSEKIIDV